MATIVKAGEYDSANLSSVAYHFGKKGEDAPVLALLEQGADPNTIEGFGRLSALHRAAQCDRPIVVRALLAAGADPNRAEKSGATPLMRAKSGAVARLLLEAGADINAVTVPNKTGLPAGRTPLMCAVTQGESEVVSVLLAYKAEMHLRDEGECNALMLAVKGEKSKMVRLLLEAGVEVGLVEASVLGDYARVQALLTAGADLDLDEITNALRWAAQGGHTDIVSLLLKSGAPIDAGDVGGRTALIHAAQYMRLGTMRLLLEHEADPNAASRNNVTALMASAGRGDREGVELLLASGAEANARSRNGSTALMMPCMWGNTELVELLLRHGADPNVFTDAEVMEREEGCSTFSALIIAVGNGEIETVKVLLQYGADPRVKNSVDRSALDIARASGAFMQAERQSIVPLLEAALADH